jgi:hypothetical protein
MSNREAQRGGFAVATFDGYVKGGSAVEEARLVKVLESETPSSPGKGV